MSQSHEPNHEGGQPSEGRSSKVKPSNHTKPNPNDQTTNQTATKTKPAKASPQLRVTNSPANFSDRLTGCGELLTVFCVLSFL